MTAGALLVDAPAPLVYLAAASAATSITLTRPIQAAILPSLSRTPSELTAANVAAGAIETGSMLVGPLVSGVVLALVGSGAVFAGSAVVTLAGAALVGGIHVLDDEDRRATVVGSWRVLLQEAFAGFGLLVREREPRAVLQVLGAAAMLWGALDVLIVVLALDVLGLGESGVGILNAALGFGGLTGSVLTLALIGRRGLSVPLAAGILLWSLPLAAIGLLLNAPMVVVLLAAAGLGRVLMDVAGRTLLQRVAQDRVLSRLFGLLEGVHMGSLALGSIVAPALVALTGQGGAFLVAGGAMILAAATTWPVLRRLDSVGVARQRDIELLRRVPDVRATGPRRHRTAGRGFDAGACPRGDDRGPAGRSRAPVLHHHRRTGGSITSTDDVCATWDRARRSARSRCCATCRARQLWRRSPRPSWLRSTGEPSWRQ